MRNAIALAAILSLFSVAAAEVQVAGDVETTTWTAAEGPYRVVGEITVPYGHVLTIEAGTQVLFDEAEFFTVRGAIHALGTATDSVIFAAGDTSGRGVLVRSATDSSSFAFTRFSGASFGALCLEPGARVGLSDCVFEGDKRAISSQTAALVPRT